MTCNMNVFILYVCVKGNIQISFGSLAAFVIYNRLNKHVWSIFALFKYREYAQPKTHSLSRFILKSKSIFVPYNQCALGEICS